MAKFTDLFIRRPVLATVVSLLILLLGLRALFELPVRQFPQVDNTVITVTTAYPGAPASLMQGFVTTPLEKAVGGADGVDYITSTSNNSTSTITAYVRLNFSPNEAFTNILSAVQTVKHQLPTAAEDPIVTKKTGGGFALMYLSFNSNKMSEQQITSYLAEVVQPKLETVSGVADVTILGGQPFAMRVWLNTHKMAALGISMTDVRTALTANNYQSAAGQIKGQYQLFNVKANTGLESESGFKKLVVKRGKQGGLIRLRDIARVELGAESYNSSVYFNNKKAVFVSVDSTPEANPLTVIGQVRKLLPIIHSAYPPSLSSHVVFDATTFISASIDEVTTTIAESALIVVLVIFLFLGTVRAVIIPIVTMPLSLIGVFSFMSFLGYSTNLLTLLALVLAIGLVVDDAIVVVENTYRHIEDGLKPLEAALQGAREIATPIISMTITLAAVYAPIAFVTGMTGALFIEFAFTLASAVILSGVIALTLSPMMCSKLLNAEMLQYAFPKRVDRFFHKLKTGYSNFLKYMLTQRKVVVVLAMMVLVSCPFLFMYSQHQLAPNEDQGFVISIISAPSTANRAYMEKFTGQLPAIYKKIPSLQDYFTINGMGAPNSAFGFVMLKSWSQRSQSENDVYQYLARQLPHIAGVQVFPFQVPPLPSSSKGPPVDFVLTSMGSYPQLYNAANKLVAAAQQSGKFIFIANSLKYDNPQVDIKINRNKAAVLGITMQSIGQSLSTALGGNYVNRFAIFNHSFEVIPQVQHKFRWSKEMLNQIYVSTSSGKLVPLSAVVTIGHQILPNSLTQFQQLNSATLQGAMMPGVSLVDGLSFLRTTAAKILPNTISYDYGGTSRDTIKEGNSLVYAMLFSLIIIFLVLAAQFESFRDPLVIIISVPMALCGALLPINWGLASVNIYTQIGLITLIGLISKHGILMVDFANHMKEKENLSQVDAIIHAAAVRLRPILMTTAAMILGVVPMILASGAGAVSRHQLGIAIAFGMGIGTFFTLFVIPTMYTIISSRLVMFLATALLIIAGVYGLLAVL